MATSKQGDVSGFFKLSETPTVAGHAGSQSKQVPLGGPSPSVKEYFATINKSQASSAETSKAMATVVNSIASMIEKDELSLGQEQRTVEQLTAEKLTPIEVIEKNLKETQLKKQQQKKEVLEEQLRFLSEDISLIKFEIDPLELSRSRIGQRTSFHGKELSDEELRELKERARQTARERNELEHKRSLRMYKDQETIKYEEIRIKAIEEEIENEKRMEKKEQLQIKYESMKSQQEDRKLRGAQAAEDLKKVLSESPMYEKIVKKAHDAEKAALEQKKQKLAEIRSLHRPMDISEIREHAKKCDDKLKEVHDKKVEEDKKNQFNYILPFVSEVYKKVQEDMPRIHQKKEDARLQEEAMQVFTKMQEYGKNSVKLPSKVDPMKQSEMQTILEKLTHKPDYKWFEKPKKNKRAVSQEERLKELQANGGGASTTEASQQKASEKSKMLDTSPSAIARRLGNNYLTQLKENHSLHISPSSSRSTKAMLKLRRDQSDQNFSENALTSNGLASPSSSIALPKKKDYLKEQRLQRASQPSESTVIDLQRILRRSESASQGFAEKAKLLLIQAEKLEEKASRKEKLARALGSSNQGVLEKEIHDNYINSIRAKFAILQASM